MSEFNIYIIWGIMKSAQNIKILAIRLMTKIASERKSGDEEAKIAPECSISAVGCRIQFS